jgi:O-antigen ligase
MLRILSLAETHTATTRRILNFIEWNFAVISLLLYSGGILFLILSGGSSEDSDPVGMDFAIARFVFFFNYLICGFFVLLRWRSAVALFSKNKLLLLLIGLICASVLWSFDPEMTLRRCFALVGTTLFGVYLGISYSLKEQTRLLAWTVGISIILSFLFIFVLPRYGIMGGYHAGAWRGIYTHKNVLGKFMVLGFALFLVLSKGSRRINPMLWFSMASSILLLVRSSSKTSLVNLLIIVLVFLFAHVFRLEFRLRGIIIILMILLSFLAAVCVAQVLPSILMSMGKNLTFSGRTTLWSSIIQLGGQRLWQGYGYGASWNTWNEATAFVWNVEGWEAPNAHNGFLDVFLDLGLIGLIIFVLGFGIALIRSISMIIRGRTPEVFWPAMFMSYLILANLTETSLLLQNSIFWPLYIAINLALVQPTESKALFVDEPNPSPIGSNC